MEKIAPGKIDEAKQVITQYTDNISALNNIRFNEPTVVIKSGDIAWDDAYGTSVSNFVSVNATISHAIAHTEVKELFSLLAQRKDDIDRVLDSQPVYAVGPDSQ